MRMGEKCQMSGTNVRDKCQGQISGMSGTNIGDKCQGLTFKTLGFDRMGGNGSERVRMDETG